MTAFLSFASEDETVAGAIVEYLERSGISCWFAPRDVAPGVDYAAAIIDGIESCAVFVLVLSEHANTSVFVKREVERAVSKGKPVFPIRVREVLPSKSLELFISSAEWIDAWHPPLEQYLERLAHAIRSTASLYSPERTGGTKLPIPSPSISSVEASGSGTRRALVAVLITGLLLAGALLWTTRTARDTADSATLSGAAATSPSAGAPVPATPGTSPAARSADGGRVPPTAAVEPPERCPASLAINRELPTPFTCICEEDSVASGAVWGTDFYTDDSALCRAARHAGVLASTGGPITVIRAPGRPLYAGTTRYGVRSSDFGRFGSSIEFRGAPPRPSGPDLCPGTLSINREIETPLTCRCSASATQEGAVWGTDVYTDDSSLCRAALHAGRITAEGGTVVVARGQGRPLYVGSARRGVVSSDFGRFASSITFP